MSDQPLRIAYLAPTYARASDTFVRSEVLELRRRGHVVHTFSMRRPDESQIVGEQVQAERANTDYVLDHNPLRLLASVVKMAIRKPRGMLQAAKLALQARRPGVRSTVWHAAYMVEAAYLAERFETLGVQLVHNHMPEAAGTVAMLAAAWAGVPLTLTVHGPLTFYAPEHWALPLKLKQAAGVACITHFCRSQCMAWSEVEDWSKFIIVHCGLDEAFIATEPTPVPDVPRLLCVGRLCPEKGQALLVQAVGRLNREGVRCDLVVVGGGPGQPAIEHIIEREQLHDCVKLLGWRPSERVLEELVASRAMALPSFAEGLPVAIMESLMLGRPVVTTRIAGIPELVVEGENGFIVAPGSVSELVAALRKVVTTPVDQLTQMGRRGAAVVAEQHNIKTEVATLERMFRQVVEHGRVDVADFERNAPPEADERHPQPPAPANAST